MCRSSSPPIFFSYHHRLYFTLFLHWLQFPFCVYSSFAFCRKLLFYSQADHFLNFVNTHTQFHFLKFIFASSSFENSFFFCCSFCVCNGNWTIYRKKEGVDATETIASWWWWWKKKTNHVRLCALFVEPFFMKSSQFLCAWLCCSLFPLTSMICKSSQGK